MNNAVITNIVKNKPSKLPGFGKNHQALSGPQLPDGCFFLVTEIYKNNNKKNLLFSIDFVIISITSPFAACRWLIYLLFLFLFYLLNFTIKS